MALLMICNCVDVKNTGV